jgi:hypothetical protein
MSERREEDGGVRPSVAETSEVRPIPDRSAVACTVEGGFQFAVEKAKGTQKEEEKEFADLQTRPTRLYLYVIRETSHTTGE